MATGANDANGVWIYGEDDSNPTFSALLNRLGNSISTTLTSYKTAAPRTVADAAARNSLFPSPVQGNSVFRTDVGYEERYYSLYNVSTNPGGVSVAGWYPVSGKLPKALARRSTTAVTLSTGWADRSATANWTTLFADNVVTYANGWIVPVTGYYEVSVAIAASDTVGVAVAPNTAPTGQTATGVFLSSVGGAVAFATGSVRARSFVRLTAGDVLKVSVISGSASTWHTTTTSIDGNHFALSYVSPPFGA